MPEQSEKRAERFAACASLLRAQKVMLEAKRRSDVEHAFVKGVIVGGSIASSILVIGAVLLTQVLTT